MFNIRRRRLLLAAVFVFAVAALGLRFGTVSQAGTLPFGSLRLLTTASFASVLTDPLTPHSEKIARAVLDDTLDGKRTSAVIFLAEQADVSAAYEMKDQDARGWFVYNTLTKHAERTQADIKSFLTSHGVEYRSFWAANMIVAEVDRSLAEQLALRRDVARVDSNRKVRWIEDDSIADRHDATDRPAATEWGVNNVNAPAVWAMGFTGQGMIVANQDTGMRWSHNAIKPKYRGWNGTTADHNFNWHDSIHSGGGDCGADSAQPCDDNGHGTHTTGTTVGDDGAGNQVGVAPGAKWIGCRNMDVGNGTPATYTECFQFFIAPTDLAGNNANPALRPHVMNNSWTCPFEEGCTTRAELETIVNNTQAAGIFVEASAGNSGSGCSSVEDAPAIYSSSFSTGAIDESNSLAGFSSRGPSTFYNPNILKPNVSAPGVNVRSSTRGSDTSFGNSSGTSMAGPHVVGVVALLWSARPQLVRDIAATKTLLQNTANPSVFLSTPQTCGGIPSTQIPNNSFGYGRVDALAAVNAAGPAGTPTDTRTPTNTATPSNTATNTPTVLPSPVPEYDLRISQSAAPNPVLAAWPLTYTLTVSNVPTPIGGVNACPNVRFGFPTGTFFSISSASGTNGYNATPDAGGVTFTGGCVASSAGSTGTATLTVVLTMSTGASGTLTSLGSNVVVDPENFWSESNETNNTAATVQTTVINETTPTNTSTPTPTTAGGTTPTTTATATVTATATATPGLRSRADFDGDNKTDISVFRPSEGNWYLNASTQGFSGVHFGLSEDIPTPGDFDGDGKADIAVFRPSDGNWYRLNSSNGTFSALNFGLSGDIPQAGDFDGDQKDDIAVFRPSGGNWYWLRSSDNQFVGVHWGQNGDAPVGGDYDGDGKDDVAVFRPSNSTWYVQSGSSGFSVIISGLSNVMPVPADYDGDNREDVALFGSSDGNWFIVNSSDHHVTVKHWGQNGDVPVPGDYDGDNKDDTAVYRGGVWYVDRSTSGFAANQFGLASDVPVPKKYIP